MAKAACEGAFIPVNELEKELLAALAARAEALPAPLARYKNCTHLSRKAVDALVESVTVGRRNAASGKVPLEIRWNF